MKSIFATNASLLPYTKPSVSTRSMIRESLKSVTCIADTLSRWYHRYTFNLHDLPIRKNRWHVCQPTLNWKCKRLTNFVVLKRTYIALRYLDITCPVTPNEAFRSITGILWANSKPEQNWRYARFICCLSNLFKIDIRSQFDINDSANDGDRCKKDFNIFRKMHSYS